MTIGYSDLQQTEIFSDFKTPAIMAHRYYQMRLRFNKHPEGCLEVLGKILKRLGRMDLPGKDQVEAYLRYLTLGNRRPRTLYSRFGTIVLFLTLLRDSGLTSLEAITRRDVEAFIEHEQDRGNMITTIRTKLVNVQAFLRYLLEEGIVSAEIFGRRIRLQLPERLPRAMDPDDLRQLLLVIQNVRNRAMILVLLRTGMRIGELLNTKMADVYLKERKIEVYEGEKNRLGRVVYLSDDAVRALRKWLKQRYPGEEYLIYTRTGTMSYSTARMIFQRYLVKAGLADKGYSLHALRHTFATEFLNAGMRLECLQVLLGHRSIEQTRRYARLTDKTREEEYFRAMSKIERRDSHDRCDPELAAIYEAQELFTPCREELSESH
ncbi:MAG: tyrosine-type recombinase/integrase [Proteobacteria bacterium]|nr:tyrosine-type recombinase/integrase [Pseudomonadota bacterium]